MTKSSAPRRACGYLRLSNLVDDTTSPARQRLAIEAYAQAHGLDLIAVHEDLDVSASARATRLDRPGLNRVRALVTSREVDVVVVFKLDRLARSLSALSTLSDEFEANGVDLVSTRESFDTSTPAGRMMRSLLGTFAEFEADTIRERVLSARSYLATTRKHGGGVAPYGYRSVPHPSGSGRALEPEPVEAGIVREAVRAVLSGSSAYAVMRSLNANPDATPRKAASWSLSSVLALLTGDAILGRMRHRGELVLGEDGLPAAVWEPIVPLADAMAVRAALARKRRGQSRRKAARLLSGLVTCHLCGSILRVNTTTSTAGHKLPRYSCRGEVDGRGCTAPVSVSAEQIESYVLDEAIRRHGDDTIYYETLETDTATAATIAGLTEAIAATTRRMTDEDADVQALVERLTYLKAALAAEREKPQTPEVRLLDSGMTFADLVAGVIGADDDDIPGDPDTLPELRDRLSKLLDGPIVLTPGQRGRRGIEPGRVRLSWVADSAVA